MQVLLQQLLNREGCQLTLIGHAHIQQRHYQLSAAQLRVVSGGQLRHPLPGHVTIQQAGQKQIPQQRQTFLVLLPQLFGVPALRPLPVQLTVNPLQHGGQLLGVNGL